METTQHDKAKRWQFNMRTMLALMGGVACFFGGWKARDWQLRSERSEVTMLTRLNEAFSFVFVVVVVFGSLYVVSFLIAKTIDKLRGM